LVASFAAIGVLAVGGAWAWRRQTIVSRFEAALPSPPALTGRPAILGELLAKAEKKTRSAASVVEGATELGRLYHANRFLPEAEMCWEFLRREQPNEARWTYYLADVRRAQSDYPGMITLLEETLAQDPAYAPARLQLANLQFKSGQLEEAERNYRLCLESTAKDPYARLGLVRIALQGGRTDEAKALLQQLIADTPHFSSAHNLYAELLAAAGDDDGATKHRWLGRETLRYREPEDPWLDELQAWCYDYDRLCVLGTIELQTEQHDRAKVYFERAIRLEPGRSDAYELLGSVYLKNSDAARARDLFEQALSKLGARTSSGVFTSLSDAYRGLNQPAEAARVARLGLEQLGQQSDLLNSLGLALAELRQHDEAVKTWETALAKNPSDAALNHNLARSLLALRRLDDALAALDRSLTLQPTYLPTLLLRGEIELRANHLEVAERYLRRAFDSHPEEPQTRRLLAEWHRQMGETAESKNDFAGAERHYRDGLALNENHPELLVRLGLFFLLHQRPAEAISPLASYLRVQPQSAPGCLFLGQAYAATHQREQAREILLRGAQLADQAGNTKVGNDCRKLLQQL
jgi:HemY protein